VRTAAKRRSLVAQADLELRLLDELAEAERLLLSAGSELDRFYLDVHSTVTESGTISRSLSSGVKPDEIL